MLYKPTSKQRSKSVAKSRLGCSLHQRAFHSPGPNDKTQFQWWKSKHKKPHPAQRYIIQGAEIQYPFYFNINQNNHQYQLCSLLLTITVLFCTSSWLPLCIYSLSLVQLSPGRLSGPCMKTHVIMQKQQPNIITVISHTSKPKRLAVIPQQTGCHVREAALSVMLYRAQHPMVH